MKKYNKIVFVALFSLGLLSGFSQGLPPQQQYGQLWMRIINAENTVIRGDGDMLININGNLNNAFKAFNVFSYKYAHPEAKNPYNKILFT